MGAVNLSWKAIIKISNYLEYAKQWFEGHEPPLSQIEMLLDHFSEDEEFTDFLAEQTNFDIDYAFGQLRGYDEVNNYIDEYATQNIVYQFLDNEYTEAKLQEIYRRWSRSQY